MDTQQDAPETNDTFLTPVLFRDGADARKSPRVPYERVMRVGSVGGEPYAYVLSENLSSGGIFIYSDKVAEIGARFSLELPLPDGERLYVPELEIVYNRPGPEGSMGFGARFVALADDIQTKIDGAAQFGSDLGPADAADAPVSPSMIIGQQTDLPMITAKPSSTKPSSTEPSSEASSEPVAAQPRQQTSERPESGPPEPTGDVPRVSDLRLSIPPEPFGALIESDMFAFELGEPLPAHASIADEIDSDVPELETEPLEPGPTVEDTQVMRARNHPPRNGTRFVERGRYHARRGLQSRPVLWGALVAIGGLGVVIAGALVRAEARDVTVEPVTDTQVVTRGISSTTHGELVGDSPALRDVDPAGEPSAPAAKPQKPSRLPPLVTVERVTPPKPAKARAKATATADKAEPPKTKLARPAPTKRADGSITIALGSTAAVLRTFVMKKPNRFVIDLVGHSGQMKTPSASGDVSRIRVGENPGFTRIVLDTKRPVQRGHLDKDGRELRVRLDYSS